MADEALRPIIIKRIKKSGGGHHGGAWKIAYADFVTAMMAFFLLMWLLSSTSEGELHGIAEYFKSPLKISMSGGSKSGESAIVIPGGGKDLIRQDGQENKGSSKRNVRSSPSEQEKIEHARFNRLKKRIETTINTNPTLSKFKNQLLIDVTTEGLRIQVIDEKNRPMFALASAQLQPYTREILREIGKTLNDVPNRISLSGHTDAKPYASGEKGYSNWELSTDRANASRRELIAGGMDESKMLRVVGLSSSILLDTKDPFNPTNRRISIIVMNKKTEEAVLNEGQTMDVSSDDEVKKGLNAPEKN